MKTSIALFFIAAFALATGLESVFFKADATVADFFAGAERDACTGRPAALYLNRLNPQGSYQGYREAVDGNAAWLAAKGYDDVELSTFIARDQDDALAFGNLIIYPDQERYLESRRNRPADRDEAFDAFVDAYAANTRGSIRLMLCLQTP